MPPQRNDAHPPSVLRLGFAAGVGTSLEMYDFSIYGTAAALVFGQVFFKTGDAWLGTFMSLATFAIGFLMAPLGAAAFGWLGDRRGRRTALFAAFTLMGVATLGMGVLPPYAVLGVAAPLLLVGLRLLHGIARGGESAGAAVFAVEHAPDRRRGLYGSFVALGSPIGTVLANLAFTFVLLLPEDDVTSWGWRLPFLAGAVVLVLGMWVRRGVGESPVFQRMAAAEGRAKRPLADVVRTNWRRLALIAGVNIGLTASTFALVTFMLSYATSRAPEGLGLPRQPIVNGAMLALLGHALANVGAAWLSDRIGRKPVMLTGAALSLASALAMFPIATTGTVTAVNTATILGFAATGILFGPMYTYFSELFPREQRQSGVGVGYHVGAVLGGGISPMIANRIVAGTGDAHNVGYYLAGLLALSLVCLLVLPETAPVRTRAATSRPLVPAGRPALEEQP
ncbi:MFS transporter [Amycolatopsis mongoliensis]|uniref:MFS transporter n=1 Tax=Amycolatopsis mongoliensis TaxID=715475 RepID=A0A9Y2JQI6_9PSEU|nr:MFS transporter [Amycolatopsis sp. 4-36]WIY01144.1 MFS transporter [Amycolatopsis sp. 4-36]